VTLLEIVLALIVYLLAVAGIVHLVHNGWWRDEELP